MKCNKQKQFEFKTEKRVLCFGGSKLTSHPKTKRPISTKNAIHLVLKSELAKGNRSMLQKYNVAKIDSIFRKNAIQFGVRIFRLVNVGNHIHLVIKLSKRHLYSAFIKAVTGVIARHVSRAERGRLQHHGKFWVSRPFTRILGWKKEFKILMGYMDKNEQQAAKGVFFEFSDDGWVDAESFQGFG